MKTKEGIRTAFSGLCPFPFRSKQIEDDLNQTQLPLETRIEHAIHHLPTPILNDTEGSSEYRIFVFKNTLQEIFTALEGRSMHNDHMFQISATLDVNGEKEWPLLDPRIHCYMFSEVN